MRMHTLQHVPFEGPGVIADWAAAHNHTLSITRLFAGDVLPTIAEIDWLIVMGGPMNIYQHDEYPWLAGEKTYIRAAIDAGKRVLGVCLGAQLIADVLGGPVTANGEREIGWFPLVLTDAAAHDPLFGALPRELPVYHWHGDTFALPPNSTLLASSAACVNQAFVYRRTVLGLQFHLEMRWADAQRLITFCGDEIGPGPYMQSAEVMLADESRFKTANNHMMGLLDRLASM